MRELGAHEHNSPLDSAHNSLPQRFAHAVIIRILKELRAILIIETQGLSSIFLRLKKTRPSWDMSGCAQEEHETTVTFSAI